MGLVNATGGKDKRSGGATKTGQRSSTPGGLFFHRCPGDSMLISQGSGRAGGDLGESVSLSLACLSCSRRSIKELLVSPWKFIPAQPGEAVIPFSFTFGALRGGWGGLLHSSSTRNRDITDDTPAEMSLRGQTRRLMSAAPSGFAPGSPGPLQEPEPEWFCSQAPAMSAHSRSSCAARRKMDGAEIKGLGGRRGGQLALTGSHLLAKQLRRRISISANPDGCASLCLFITTAIEDAANRSRDLLWTPHGYRTRLAPTTTDTAGNAWLLPETLGLDDASLDARLTDANGIRICRLRRLEPFKEIEREQRKRNGTEWCSRKWPQTGTRTAGRFPKAAAQAEGTPELAECGTLKRRELFPSLRVCSFYRKERKQRKVKSRKKSAVTAGEGPFPALSEDWIR